MGTLVPDQMPAATPRQRLVGAVVGMLLLDTLALLGWLFWGSVEWFYLVPAGALLGWLEVSANRFPASWIRRVPGHPSEGRK